MPLLPLLLLAWLFLSAPTCTRSADHLQAQIDAAGVGGHVAIEGDYILCRRVRPLEGQVWEGSGRLERCAVPRSRLAEPARAGDTSVVVENAMLFPLVAGELLGFGQGGRQTGDVGCKAHWITSATGDTIQFYNGLCRDFPVGTPVFAMFPLVEVQHPDVTLRGFTLDGAGPSQPAYHDWGAPVHDLLARGADDLVVEDVRFERSWSNGLHVLSSDDVQLRDIDVQGSRCAGIHIGATNDLSIEGARFHDIGARSVACGHTEGTVTYSLDNEDVSIVDSCFDVVRAPLGAIALMNLERNEGLHLEANRVCDGPHVFAAQRAGPGAINAIDNEVYVGGEPFVVPEGTDFAEEGTLLRAEPCTCPEPGGL